MFAQQKRSLAAQMKNVTVVAGATRLFFSRVQKQLETRGLYFKIKYVLLMVYAYILNYYIVMNYIHDVICVLVCSHLNGLFS